MKLSQIFNFAKSKRINLDEISSQESLLYKTYNIEGYNPDGLVGKKGLRIYEEMQTDEQIKACLTLKKYARLSTGWEIKPGDEDDKLSIELADFVQHNTKRLKGTFYDALLGILSALAYGYSINEKVLEYIEEGEFRGKIGLKAIKSREPFGYNFQTDKHGNLEGITFESGSLVSGSDLGSADKPFPPERFIIYSYNKEFSNWYGNSDLRACYRSWWSKKIVIKYFNIFLERFGMPTAYMKYPQGLDSKILEELDNILKNLQAKSAFRIPEDITVELLEATRRGEAGYEKAIELYNTMIARGILIPELTGFTSRASGSRSLGETQLDVFIWILEKLGRDIEETIVEEQIFRPLIDINYENVDEEQYPLFKLNSLSEKDTEARSKVVVELVKVGLISPDEEWVRDYLMIPKKAEDDVIPSPDQIKGKPKEKPEEEPEEEKFALEAKYILNRKPNRFERKVNFESFAEKVKATDDMLREALVETFKKQRDKLLRDVERNKVIENKDYSFIAKLQLSEVGKVKSTIQNHMIKAHLDNKIAVLEEMQRAGEKVTVVKKFVMEQGVFEPWHPVPPAEAIKLFEAKVLATIVKQDGGKVLITMVRPKELQYYDSRAFAIAGIERDYVLKEAKIALQNGIKQGSANKKVQEDLREIFNKYITVGEIKDGKLLSPTRLETIVRTNISDAINQGRKAMFNAPETQEFIPYLMFSAVIDSRTTEYCEWMDGRSFKRTDPLLIEPPCHFNCRSILTPITQVEVDREVKAGKGIEVGDINDNPYARAEGFSEEG